MNSTLNTAISEGEAQIYISCLWLVTRAPFFFLVGDLGGGVEVYSLELEQAQPACPGGSDSGPLQARLQAGGPWQARLGPSHFQLRGTNA